MVRRPDRRLKKEGLRIAPREPTNDDARDAGREEGAELEGVRSGVPAPDDAGEVSCEPGPCLWYASAKKRIVSSKAVTSLSIS